MDGVFHVEQHLSIEAYIEFLKTMLAEVLDDDDEIFTVNDRMTLEMECLSLGMSLPLVRVVEHAP